MADEKNKEKIKENKVAPIKPVKKSSKIQSEYSAKELATMLGLKESKVLSLFSILKIPRDTGKMKLQEARDKYSKIMGKR